LRTTDLIYVLHVIVGRAYDAESCKTASSRLQNEKRQSGLDPLAQKNETRNKKLEAGVLMALEVDRMDE
jgi:hypothetical protein